MIVCVCVFLERIKEKFLDVRMQEYRDEFPVRCIRRHMRNGRKKYQRKT